MGNGSIHPKEKELAKRLGDDYVTEKPPEGAKVVGDAEEVQETTASAADRPATQESTASHGSK